MDKKARVERIGLWWEDLKNYRDIRVLRDYKEEEGFNRKEASEIIPQIEEISREARKEGVYKQTRVIIDGKRTKILISSIGYAEKRI